MEKKRDGTGTEQKEEKKNIASVQVEAKVGEGVQGEEKRPIEQGKKNREREGRKGRPIPVSLVLDSISLASNRNHNPNSTLWAVEEVGGDRLSKHGERRITMEEI